MFEVTDPAPAQAEADAEAEPEADGGWRATLNPEQREAVEHPGGPVLVVAGAGSGKTWTLACRVAHLVEGGVPPQRILLLTFTRRAAREMLARSGRLTGRDVGGRVWGGTFHAVANRLLRIYGRPLGLRPDFTVMDQADAADLMNLVRGELRLGTGERRFPRKDTLAAVYSRAVNAREKLPAVLRAHFPWCGEEVEGIRAVFQSYTERKRAQNVLDYDDLLLHWLALVRNPETRERLNGLFHHVLVDEYQDTNALQADILAGLWRPGDNLMVVGDDAQAIYSFRAATVRNILEFPDRFPGTAVIKLERNYRSIPPLLDASNAVISLSPQRHDKTLWSRRTGTARPLLMTCLDEAQQSDEICRAVLEHRERGTLLRNQAVLFRATHHSDLLEVELGRRNIPYVKYGGLKFLEAAHVKDVLACLRILENPFDEVSWFRVLHLLEGIGPAGAKTVIEALGVRRRDDDQGSPLRRLFDQPPPLRGPAATELARFAEAMEGCAKEDPPIPTAAQVERLRGFLEPIFHKRYAAAASRIRDLEQLEHLAGAQPSRSRFIADLTLDPPVSTGDLAGPPHLDEDYLILSTVHSAKGGEWDVVYVIHSADGMFPSDMATGDVEQIEEERRLFYVALTRARDALYVTWPLRYYHRPRGLDDKHSYAQITRFLPPEVQELFELRAAMPEVEVDQRGPDGSTVDRSGVDTYLAELWS